MPAKPVNSPQPTTVYARTGKGVLAFKNRTAKVPAQIKDLFSCIDGKASVADLRTQSKMAAAELDQALDKLEEQGYIKVFKQGADQSYQDLTDVPDLDFTGPGSLLEISVREAAKAKADAEQRTPDEAVQLPEEPVQVPPDTAPAAAEEQPHANTEAVALEARIQDLEAETRAVRRARDEAIKGLAQAKSLAAEERTRAEAERRSRVALQTELAEAKLECERASATARQHAERTAQVELEIDTERRARAEAEAKAIAERESREKATQALREVKNVIGSWKDE